MKAVLQLMIILSGVLSCPAQGNPLPNQPCRLSLRDLPALEAYKLGMDIVDVDLSKIISRNARYNEDYIKTKSGDSTYYLTFENKKLRLITVQYRSLKVENLDAFTAYLNKSLNLPDSWKKQTPEQIEIEKHIPDFDQQLKTLMALRAIMLQLHGWKCGHAKRIEKEIPKLLTTVEKLEEKRQIGSRLSCNGFSIIAFLDNSIEPAVPSLHLFLPEKGNDVRLKP